VEFYKGNKLIRELELDTSFICPPNGVWNLLYADKLNHPVLNLRVFESNKLFYQYKDLFPTFQSIPVGELVIIGQNSFSVKWPNSKDFVSYSGNSLYQEYLKRELVLQTDYVGKPFNSRASSFYHVWQSKQRFVGGITDIDLLRVDGQCNPIELFEVKRSRISVDSWKPYFDDRGGYDILDNFCSLENLEFTIVYYYFLPNKSLEDLNSLLILKKLNGFNFTKIGIYNLKDFKMKAYHS